MNLLVRFEILRRKADMYYVAYRERTLTPTVRNLDNVHGESVLSTVQHRIVKKATARELWSAGNISFRNCSPVANR